MDTHERQLIIDLIQREVIPAIGCTEPVAVALAVAKATELLGNRPDFIEVYLSPNVLKNAMGVGIPGTGMYGLPIAIAMGAICGKSAYGLKVLQDITPALVEEGKKMISDKKMKISLTDKNVDKLYIEVVATHLSHTSTAVISGDHTRFSLLECDGKTLFKLEEEVSTPESALKTIPLSFDTVCNFALTTPLDDLRFILKTVEINKAAASESLKGIYGHGIAQTLAGGLMGNNVYTHMLSYTAAACDARMAGAMIPVMSNSGSGNQGITATLPVSVFAEETGKSEEELIRALSLSHLMTIYIKESLGRLSGLCGAVVAATGSSCGITYLMGGTREQIGYAIKNMIGNITGMICDGAKPSCTLKVSNGVSTATLSAMMAIDNKVVTSVEGIADEDVDKTIHNLTKIGRVGMLETDRMILEIMTTK